MARTVDVHLLRRAVVTIVLTVMNKTMYTIFAVSFKKQVVNEKGRVSMKPHKVLIEAADFESASAAAQALIDGEDAPCELGTISATKYETCLTVRERSKSE